jgi:hypothetical protein
MNLTYKQLLIITEVRQYKGIHKKTTLGKVVFYCLQDEYFTARPVVGSVPVVSEFF